MADKARHPGERLRALFLILCGVGLFAAAFWPMAHSWWIRFNAVSPPSVNMDGIDAAIVTAIEQARDAVAQSPRSAAAWGHLGMVFFAHEYYAPAAESFGHAERLDPRDARWPWLAGLSLLADHPAQAVPKLQQGVKLCNGCCVAQRLRLAEVL